MTEYTKDKEIENAVVRMLSCTDYSEFDAIRAHEVVIESCLKVRIDKNGENEPCKGEPVTLKKIGAVEKILCGVDYVVIVDNSAWQACSSQVQKEAIIHHGLMKISIDADEAGIKTRLRKPDIVEFAATVTRFGAYNDALIGFRDAFEVAAGRLAEELKLEKL